MIRALYHRINNFHERALRIAHKDQKSDIDILLEQNNSVAMHARNLQLLMTKVFKTMYDLNPHFMIDIFIE